MGATRRHRGPLSFVAVTYHVYAVKDDRGRFAVVRKDRLPEAEGICHLESTDDLAVALARVEQVADREEGRRN